MVSQNITSLLLALLVTSIQVIAHPQLEHQNLKRGICHSNNCLRALLSPHNSAAVQFCESYISASTTTISSTLIKTVTFDNQFTQPYTTIIVTTTSTRFTTTTFTRSHTLPTNPFPPTTTSTSTSKPTFSLPPFSNSTLPPPLKRSGPTVASDHPLPTYLSACNFNPEKIRSACSCVVAPLTTVTRNFTTYAVTDRVLTLPTITSIIGTVVVKVNTTIVTLYEP